MPLSEESAWPDFGSDIQAPRTSAGALRRCFGFPVGKSLDQENDLRYAGLATVECGFILRHSRRDGRPVEGCTLCRGGQAPTFADEGTDNRET